MDKPLLDLFYKKITAVGEDVSVIDNELANAVNSINAAIGMVKNSQVANEITDVGTQEVRGSEIVNALTEAANACAQARELIPTLSASMEATEPYPGATGGGAL